MTKYIRSRILQILPLMFGITIVTFLVTEMAPGDPSDMQTQLNPKMSMESKQQLLEYYGLNDPTWKRYLTWMGGVMKFDFGYSFKDGESVTRKICERIPITLTINICAMLLIFIIAIPIGVLGAVYQGRWQDHILSVVSFVGFSIPTFWLALVLMSFFGVRLHWLPVSGIHSLDYEYMSFFDRAIDLSKHLVLPITVTALTGFAGVSRYMRSSMIEVLHQDYIKTAWSKGLSRRRVLYGHAFRNAVLPIVTLIGLSIPGLLGGSVIFETIFSIPGMGKLMYDSVMARDMPVYMAILTIGAFLTLVCNLLADLSYRWIDPRIRYEANSD